METIQQEYLKKLVNATETYIKKLEEVQDDAHFYQVRVEGRHIVLDIADVVVHLHMKLKKYKDLVD
jgi:ribosomal silencing factor RsfS|tara:strand:+ start:1222 stop:1419 length:198 start_codon:yes stop_codon:yes gene_type:complete